MAANLRVRSASKHSTSKQDPVQQKTEPAGNTAPIPTPLAKLDYSARSPADVERDALVCFVCQERSLPENIGRHLPPSLSRFPASAWNAGDFRAKASEVCVLHAAAGAVKRLLLVGLGPADVLDRETLRRAAGSAAQRLQTLPVQRAGVLLPELPSTVALSPTTCATAIGEGFLLGAYRFQTYRSADAEDASSGCLQELILHDPQALADSDSWQQGGQRAQGICLARDFGNTPGNVLTPARLAEEARRIAQTQKLDFELLQEDALRKIGLRMLVAVGQGSREPPQLAVLRYRPPQPQGRLLFVGKGVTFDSGGISIKPGAAMDEMKFDMCGAAAVLGAMQTIAACALPVEVIGVTPLCENLPGGNALKPGDIIEAYNGKHVEVLNTDAEGRLILGDALAYAVKRFRPDAVVDLATLTGACVVALGHYASGAVSNHEELQERVVQAGRSSGDRVWPLPAFAEYEDSLKGRYGDLRNIGGRDAGAITGGLFLKPFVNDTPWVHLDIAGTAWGVRNVGHAPNLGATGVGVALLTDLARNWSGPLR